MPEFTAADVKRLRDLTGAGMMDCKRALTDADGDFAKAADLVRERTGAKMAKRAGERSASEGLVHAYLHNPTPGVPPRVGVLLQLSCETDFVAKSDAFRALAGDVALHIAAADPLVISEEQVDDALVAKEREFAEKKAREEGKPDHIIDKIVEGKLKAFYSERVLMNQPFVKDDSKTIADLLGEVQRTTGEKVEVAAFTRFAIGSVPAFGAASASVEA